MGFLSPLSTLSLGRLLRFADLVSEEDDVEDVLQGLQAILNIPEISVEPVRLNHPSFCDVLGKDRCSDDRFWVDERGSHEKLASRCLDLMSAPGGLQQDILVFQSPRRWEVRWKRRQWSEACRRAAVYVPLLD